METSKLKILADAEGFLTIEDLMAEAAFDSVVPGICENDGCDYTTEVEPDCDEGHCECCQTNTVKSAFVLAGCI